MLTAVIRKSDEGVRLSLHNVEGMPLYASTTSKHDSVEEAKSSVARLNLNWGAPATDSDSSVVLIGKEK